MDWSDEREKTSSSNRNDYAVGLWSIFCIFVIVITLVLIREVFMVFWSNGLWYGFRNNVVKWWRQITLPVFHVDNDSTQTVAEQAKQHKKNWLQGNASEDNPQNVSEENEEEQENDVNTKLTTDNQNAMDVLNRIEREKEEKNKREIEEARQKAKEQERINAIMDANKVSVDDFIEEGKARGNTEKLAAEATDETSSENGDDGEKATKQEELRRAQEIIDRLNHEADEDEEKKEAEIEAAKAVAREKFGA
jgi:hypothetical protein